MGIYKNLKSIRKYQTPFLRNNCLFFVGFVSPSQNLSRSFMWKKSKEENCFDRPNWLCKKTVNFIFNVQLFF